MPRKPDTAVATTSTCREDAAARVAAKTEASIEALKTRLYTSLEAAEVRRQALLEAEKERLRAGHELVLTRLVSGIGKEEKQADVGACIASAQLPEAGRSHGYRTVLATLLSSAVHRPLVGYVIQHVGLHE
jgi:hypothetical protein